MKNIVKKIALVLLAFLGASTQNLHSAEKEEKIKNENIYGIAGDENKKPYMQDSGIIVLKPDKFAFFGIFDGHGSDGDYIAEYVCDNLYKNITKNKYFIDDIEIAIINGFLITNRNLDVIKRFNSGSTAVIALIPEKKDKIYIAWAGDSRAIKITKDWQGIDLSFDHKPNREDEKKRIEELGGEIRVSPSGTARVYKEIFNAITFDEYTRGLAVSRAFGDKDLRPFVIADPEILSYPFDVGNDNYLILGSDGIWDVLKAEDVANFIKYIKRKKRKNSRRKKYIRKNPYCTKQTLNLNKLARMLLEEVKRRGSKDNLSVIIVNLKKLKNAL